MTIASNNVDVPRDAILLCCGGGGGCKYVWRYRGRAFVYATCPSCRKNIRIEENKITMKDATGAVTGQGNQPMANAESAPMKRRRRHGK